jgi:PIF1-like helicase
MVNVFFSAFSIFNNFIFPISEEYNKLNADQKAVVDHMDELMADYRRGESNQSRVLYLDGKAGTGKTTTFNVVFNRSKSRGDEVVCAAYTGVAAALLPNGKTLHSAFGLPVPLRKDSLTRLQPQMQQ